MLEHLFCAIDLRENLISTGCKNPIREGRADIFRAAFISTDFVLDDPAPIQFRYKTL